MTSYSYLNTTEVPRYYNEIPKETLTDKYDQLMLELEEKDRELAEYKRENELQSEVIMRAESLASMLFNRIIKNRSYRYTETKNIVKMIADSLETSGIEY